MSSHETTERSPWGKALAVAVLVTALVVLLFSRSSCSTQLQEARQAAAAAESNDAEESLDEDLAEDGTDDSSDLSDESNNGEAETERKPDPPEEEPPAPDSDAMASEEANTSSESQPEADTLERVGDSSDDAAPAPATPDSGGDSGSTGQSIGGLSVKGERLGVILDVSGSMTRYLDELRREIQAGFSGAVFLEVEGCLLEPVNPEIEAPEKANTFSRRSVMNAVFELSSKHQVDSIYWFCDLQDTQTDQALTELKSLALGESNHSRGFRLYIRSTDEEPSEALETIIRKSGGAYERRR